MIIIKTYRRDGKFETVSRQYLGLEGYCLGLVEIFFKTLYDVLFRDHNLAELKFLLCWIARTSLKSTFSSP